VKKIYSKTKEKMPTYRACYLKLLQVNSTYLVNIHGLLNCF